MDVAIYNKAGEIINIIVAGTVQDAQRFAVAAHGAENVGGVKERRPADGVIEPFDEVHLVTKAFVKVPEATKRQRHPIPVDEPK